ncbi:MAG: CRISPR-associated endonuclease Cas3'', partial [Acidobacteria bacterium 37-65-4]
MTADAAFIAHHRESDGATQPLSAHLLAVAAQASRFAGKIGLAPQGELIGILHDLGKYSDEFQAYLKSAVGLLNQDDDEEFVDSSGLKGKVDHSTAGARLVWTELEKRGELGQIVGQVLVVERPAVGEARQWVVQGPVQQLLGQLALFGDVAVRGDEVENPPVVGHAGGPFEVLKGRDGPQIAPFAVHDVQGVNGHRPLGPAAARLLGDLSGRSMIAEGIANPADLALWLRMGGRRIQGYHLAPPLPENAFFTWYPCLQPVLRRSVAALLLEDLPLLSHMAGDSGRRQDLTMLAASSCPMGKWFRLRRGD